MDSNPAVCGRHALALAWLCTSVSLGELQIGEKNSTYLARCEATEVGAQLLGCNDADATASVCVVLVTTHLFDRACYPDLLLNLCYSSN
jgi:hypothetical protein